MNTRLRTTVLSIGAALALATGSAGIAGAQQEAPPQDRAQAMAAACQDGWLCVWDEAGGHGKRVDLYQCGYVDVREHGLARVGSYVNNQTDGTTATFRGPDPANPDGPWIDLFSSRAFEINEDSNGFTVYGTQVC